LTKCIMVGYADDHSPNTYHMYDPQTHIVHSTQNVCWTNWKCTDPADTLNIFKHDEKTKHSSPIGATEDDKPEHVAINFPSPDDIFDDEMGRIVTPIPTVTPGRTSLHGTNNKVVCFVDATTDNTTTDATADTNATTTITPTRVSQHKVIDRELKSLNLTAILPGQHTTDDNGNNMVKPQVMTPNLEDPE